MPADTNRDSQSGLPEQRWPGERLGLPESGPRSIARPGRRIGALVVDWALSVVISIAFFEYAAFATLGIFALTQIVFLISASGSIGHLIFRMRVVPMRGGWIGPWRPIVRTLLLCLVIPALIWDRDQRGLHDKAAGTLIVLI
ncbi:MAG: RDD family protein [Cryobacterium sp.]|nr:RDD family protein [Cryobacterium sp.]MBX3090468.1 RDD family protein [Cryobacterium sp.]MCO5293859.1 RDD family protein [Homoserinimonas sp.]MCW5944492.1 RDD family protein [Cryobacterium sp.]